MSDEAQLEAMGYKTSLPRTISPLAILGLSFAIMAVPFGESTTLSIGLVSGGPVTILYGWVLLTLISLGIAASLGEICSVYPCAGGVYYWSACLATEEWRGVASWVTGWIGLVGNITVTTSICFSGGQLVISAIGLWNEEYAPEPWHTLLMYWVCLLIALVVNVTCSKYLNQINTACIYWTAASVFIILITTLVLSPTRRSASYVFTSFDPSRSGWNPGWTFFVGLLQSAYTLTGYGMVAAMCEEVQHPERHVPKAMVWSVFAAGVTGVIYLVPILFVMPDVDELLAVPTGQPIGLLFKIATGSPAGGFGLLFLILGILFFAGVGSQTATSRNLYAFSRDGAVPFSHIWSRLPAPSAGGKKGMMEGVPVNALIGCTIIEGLLGLIYLGSAAAFNAFTGSATICLSASYAAPIFVLLLRGRKQVSHAPFSLGKFGFVINAITIVWILLAIVLFTMPTAIPVTAGSMNYASVLFVFFACVSVFWYVIWGRKHFSGPPIAAGHGHPGAGLGMHRGTVEGEEVHVVKEKEKV